LVLHARPKRVVVSVFDYRVKGGNNSCSSDYTRSITQIEFLLPVFGRVGKSGKKKCLVTGQYWSYWIMFAFYAHRSISFDVVTVSPIDCSLFLNTLFTLISQQFV